MDSKNKKLKIKSPAKINLHLEVLGKRQDGFHELSMIMQNIDLSDYLEMELNSQGKLNLSTDNSELTLSNDNLIIKAAEILRNYFPSKNLGADIFLKKNIPIGAGLAGGSSNAAATLVGLNKLWELNLSKSSLHQFASKLGSDVPFFLKGGSQYCFGRGEILEQTTFNSKYALILLKNPTVSISTSEVYDKYFKKFHNTYLSSESEFEEKRNHLRSKNFSNIHNFNKDIQIRNDLQKIVQNENKSVNDALSIFSRINECLCFAMSGSGPSCYAIFKNHENAKIVYEKNKKLFKEFGFNAWLCQFLESGINII